MKTNQSLRTVTAFFLSLSFISVFASGCGFAKRAESKSPVKTANQNSTESNSPAASDNKDAGKLFGTNLIKDGDAEAENHNIWKPSDDLKTLVYGEYGGGPDKESPGPSNRGEKYFYANVSNAHPIATFKQTIDVGAAGETIDKKTVNFNLNGWFGSANGSIASARMKIAFLDKDGKEISTDGTVEIKESERPTDGVLLERGKTGSLPVGTRKIEVRLEFYVYPGRKDEESDGLAFADNLSLTLTQKP